MLQKDPINFPPSPFPSTSILQTISMAAVPRENETYRETMSSLEWSKSRKKMIEEQANAELESLQLLYPNRFEYLKLELKSFIHLLQSQSEEPFPQPHTVLTSKCSPSPSSLAPDSQESSSCRKRKKMEEGRNGLQREVGESESKIERRKDRVDVVLERAAVCLCKIRRFKTALFSTAG
ncbi:uncharacterized protein LOC120070912 [Benincasa hispida]|uniref:uncharacterized protein LOC120070912 n=1 Tax=Benincasa hispida TaxID=102211 RepID=UPI00190170E8|nr:uncharacterized protein LOC120070912 [Benincasa hispida]XP_038878739.1 uncharacterized protein LOC120070912 [Benincasa hispida]